MEQTIQRVSYNDLLDRVELAMHQKGLIEIEPISVFTPGLYSRSIIVPPNVWLLSHIHKNEHQFIMSEGTIAIITEQDKLMVLQGPYLNVTMPNTRRLAKTLTRVVWTSFHATDIMPKNKTKRALKEAIELVEAELYEKRENILLIKESEELCPQ